MKKTMTIAAASIALIAGANAATIIHGIGRTSDAGANLTAGTPTEWTAAASNPISVDAGDGVTFDYTVTLTGAAQAGESAGQLEATNGSDFANGDTFSVAIAISNVVGGTAVFDGFTYLDGAAIAGGEGFTIGGLDYERGTGGSPGTPNLGANGAVVGPLFAGPTGGTLEATAIGSLRLGGLEWQFTTEAAAIPEPSSTALLGLGGLALILRRRK